MQYFHSIKVHLRTAYLVTKDIGKLKILVFNVHSLVHIVNGNFKFLMAMFHM